MDQTKMKEEAIQRLKLIGFNSDVIATFEDGKLLVSEVSSIGALLKQLDKKPEWLEKVRQVEAANDILVYHVTHESTPFGDLLTMLYVGKYEEEWEKDKEDLTTVHTQRLPGFFGIGKSFVTIAYCYDLSYPDMSEFGSVGLCPFYEGLIRVA